MPVLPNYTVFEQNSERDSSPGLVAALFARLADQSPIPGEKGIRLGNTRDIPQSFASESFGDLG